VPVIQGYVDLPLARSDDLGDFGDVESSIDPQQQAGPF